MSTTDLQQQIALVQGPLRAFLKTLLQEEAHLTLGAPVSTRLAEVEEWMNGHFVVMGAGPTGNFALVVEADWLPLLTKGTGAEDGPDAIRQAVAQGYTALAPALGFGTEAPSLEVRAPGAPLPAERLPGALWTVSFSVQMGSQDLGGFALWPDPPASAHDDPLASAAFPDFGSEHLGDGATGHFEVLAEVELEVTVELGRRRLPLADVLRLTKGSVVELEKLVGEPLSVYANGRLIAEGEAVVVDEQFGVRITRLAAAAANPLF